MSNLSPTQLLLRRAASTIATLSRLKPETQQGFLALLAQDFSRDVISLQLRSMLRMHGLEALLGEMPTKQISFTEQPLAVFGYLSKAESFCFHGTLTLKGTYGSLRIGPHQPTADCNYVASLPHAKAIASLLVTRGEAFGIVLHNYVVREVVHYTDQSIAARCYGLEREILLRALPAKGEKN